MSDYSRQWDFSTLSGQPILGSNVDDEFDELVTVIATKVDESREGAASGVATLTAGSVLPAGVSGNATLGGGQVPEASESNLGGVELATTAEITTGTDPLRVVTAAELKTHLDAAYTAGAGTGLAESSRVLSVDLNELGTETSIAAGDFIAMVDITDSGSQKITLANLEAAITHDNLSGFVANEHIDHSTVDVIAGAGMTGGGDITSDVTLNVIAGTGITVNANDVELDISGLTTIAGNALAGGDSFLVYDTSAATHKRVTLQQAGLIVNDRTTTSAKTFTDSDMNQVWTYNNASDATAWQMNTGIGETGDFVILVQKGVGSIDWDGGSATISNENSFTHTKQASSVVILLCIATNTWVAYGSAASS
jgi:hypothetical protein